MGGDGGIWGNDTDYDYLNTGGVFMRKANLAKAEKSHAGRFQKAFDTLD